MPFQFRRQAGHRAARARRRVVLVAFELAPRVGILPRATFPPLSESARALGDLVEDGATSGRRCSRPSTRGCGPWSSPP